MPRVSRVSRVLRRLLLTTVCGALLLPALGAGPAQAAMPSQQEWLADVTAAMRGSQRFVDARATVRARPEDGRLAVNLDIDNTSLSSHYDYGKAIGVTLRFARNARENDVAVLFNTGRVVGDGRLARARRLLVAAGFPVTAICGRSSSTESLAASKQRCRQQYVDRGYTIIANVGNRATDFVGDNYERAYRLPNYGNQLA